LRGFFDWYDQQSETQLPIRPNANSHCYSYSQCYSDGFSDANGHNNTYTQLNANTYWYTQSNAEATPDSASSADSAVTMVYEW